MEPVTLSRVLPSEVPIYSNIVACGGVKGYAAYRRHQEKENRKVLSAMARLSGTPELAVNSLFPDHADEVIESAVTGVGRKRMVIANEFINAGLITNLPNWWAVPSLRRGRTGEGGSAHRSMIPDSRGERFVLTRDGVSWPIYCTWANFSFDVRELAIGARMGTPLDTSHTTEAVYRVNEAVEDQTIHGATDESGNVLAFDGLTAPGLLSSTTTFDYTSWNDAGMSGADIEDVVLDAIELMRITHPGPYMLIIPGNYTKKVNTQYTTTYDGGTILSKLEALGPYGGSKLRVVVADTLPDDRVILVQMDSSAVDMIIGQQPVPLSWQDGPKLHTFWLVLSCVIFRMFADKNGKFGVAVGDLT